MPLRNKLFQEWFVICAHSAPFVVNGGSIKIINFNVRIEYSMQRLASSINSLLRKALTPMNTNDCRRKVCLPKRSGREIWLILPEAELKPVAQVTDCRSSYENGHVLSRINMP